MLSHGSIDMEVFLVIICCGLRGVHDETVNYPKKTETEQNAGFSAQIHRVTLTKTWFLKKARYLREEKIIPA